MSRMMDVHGGDLMSREFAKKIVDAEAGGLLTEAALGKMAAGGAVARTYDAFLEAWINGLLSNPMTHAVNNMSNTFLH